MKVLVSCVNGSGTSLMMKKSVERALSDLNIPISEIHHCSVSEGIEISPKYDVVFCPMNFVNMFEAAAAKGVNIIGVKNVMSAKEIGDRVEAETDLKARFGK